jgi:sugar phosphate isomerase/epimerase
MAGKRSSVGLWAYIWGGYTVNPVPHEKAVETVAGLGFDGVEVAACEPYFTHNSSRNRRLLRKLYDDNGLERSGLYAPFPSAVVTGFKEYLEAVKSNLDICVDVGISSLRVDTSHLPGDLPPGWTMETAMSRAAENWSAAAEECARAGVRLNWEFEPGYMFNKPSEVLSLIGKVDHPNFSLLFDTCHAHMCASAGARQNGEPEILPGGILEFIGKCEGRIGHIHLIDSDGTLEDGETSAHIPFGSGVIDFDRVMPALNEAGCRDDWWVIDLCYWPNALEETAGSKRFLDGLIDKYGR